MESNSRVFMLSTGFLSFKQGGAGITNSMNPEEEKMISELGSDRMLIPFSILNLVVGLLILFPQTFFIANMINAVTILTIIGLSLKSGTIKTALIEIPFLLIPLVLIYLGHPFKK